MAERVLEGALDDAGVSGIEVDSVGISSEEEGEAMDPRARRVLERAGYRSSGHVARRVTKADVENADLLIAAESFHLDRLRALGARDEQLRLMTDFDPDSEPGAALADPWYGDESDFENTLEILERAMPHLVAEVKR